MQAQPKTGTTLDRIVEARRAAVEHRKKVVPLPVLKMAVKRNEKPRDLAAALSRDALNVIAELKKVSPSRGVLRKDFQVKRWPPASNRPERRRFPCSPRSSFFRVRSST